MKLEYAELLASMDADIEVRTDYSGRGMCGETTTAVTFPELFYLFRAIAEAAGQLGSQDAKEASRFATAMGKLRTDSMGRDTIAY